MSAEAAQLSALVSSSVTPEKVEEVQQRYEAQLSDTAAGEAFTVDPDAPLPKVGGDDVGRYESQLSDTPAGEAFTVADTDGEKPGLLSGKLSTNLVEEIDKGLGSADYPTAGVGAADTGLNSI